jgi:hypothetical protein
MSKSVARFTGNSLDRVSGRNLPARIERAVENEVALVHGRAIVAAANVRAVDYVTTDALQAVEGLSRLEELALQRTPIGDARYKAIVDVATGALVRIVDETGRA